jgi:hypothetical protein
VVFIYYSLEKICCTIDVNNQIYNSIVLEVKII